MREGSEEYLIVYCSTSIVVVKGVGIWQYHVDEKWCHKCLNVRLA